MDSLVPKSKSAARTTCHSTIVFISPWFNILHILQNKTLTHHLVVGFSFDILAYKSYYIVFILLNICNPYSFFVFLSQQNWNCKTRSESLLNFWNLWATPFFLAYIDKVVDLHQKYFCPYQIWFASHMLEL